VPTLELYLKETFSESSFMTNAVSDTADGSMKVYWWSLPVQTHEVGLYTLKSDDT
jgi:hypothetical protein